MTVMHEALDDLVKHCQGVLKGMTSCSKSLCASAGEFGAITAPLPVLVDSRESLVHPSRPRNPTTGLSDDPEALVEDVLFESHFIHHATPPATIPRHVMSSAKLRPPTTAAPGSENHAILSDSAARSDQKSGGMKCFYFSLKFISIKEKTSQITLVIKSARVREEVKNVEVEKELGLWIPHSRSDSVLHIIIEVWTDAVKTTAEEVSELNKGVPFSVKNNAMWICAGMHLGIAKVNVPVSSESKQLFLLEDVMYPIENLLSGTEAGTLQVSLMTAEGYARRLSLSKSETWPTDTHDCDQQKQSIAGNAQTNTVTVPPSADCASTNAAPSIPLHQKNQEKQEEEERATKNDASSEEQSFLNHQERVDVIVHGMKLDTTADGTPRINIFYPLTPSSLCSVLCVLVIGECIMYRLSESSCPGNARGLPRKF